MPSAKAVTRIVPALTARTQFGQILKRVRTNRERFVVDRRGEPQAVIMGVEDYLKNFAKRPAALKRIRQEAKARRLDRLSLREINLEIAGYRRKRSRARG